MFKLMDIEKEILKYWKDKKIYEKDSKKGKKDYNILLDQLLYFKNPSLNIIPPKLYGSIDLKEEI